MPSRPTRGAAIAAICAALWLAGMTSALAQTTATLTGVVAVVILSTLVDVALVALQRRLTPWARARGG